MLDAERLSQLLKQFRFLINSRPFYAMDGRIYCAGLFEFEAWHKEQVEAFVKALNEAMAPATAKMLDGVVAAMQQEVARGA